ncbi:MAG TPA: lysylphosphatidylglycerol synthase transmembrane domain-containing protein [Phycisphaerae bacterium]|nr:lysylphosphatidylglycerol synthase transmembrane domain-containing protein [Phycisphaerae bacterium]
MLKQGNDLHTAEPNAAQTASPEPGSSARRKLRTLVCAVILIAFFGWAGWYGYRHRQEFLILGEAPWWSVVALAAASAATIYCNGLYIKFVLQAFGVDLPAKEWLSLTVATSILNFLSPMRGGSAMRAVYLKARYRFSFTDFFSSLGAMYLMYGFVHACMGLCGAALLWGSSIHPPLPLTAFFGAVAVISILLMTVPIRVPWPETFGFRQLARILEGWGLLRRNSRVFAWLMVVTVLYALLSVVQFKIAFFGIGAPVQWGAIMLYTAGQGLAMLITITPGALGVAEWTGVYLGVILSCTPAQVLLIQLLVRATYISVLFLASPFVGRFLVAAQTQPTPSATPRGNA